VIVYMINIGKYQAALESSSFIKYSGKVSQVIGLTIESLGPAVKLGEICHIYPLKGDTSIKAEVVGFKGPIVLLMPLGEMDGIGPGSKVIATDEMLSVGVGSELLGRILDGLGNPLDDLEKLHFTEKYPVNNIPPHPLKRKKVENVLSLGVKTIDGLLTCGIGQRMGIFAGSGVGKSTLMGMIARNTNADINIIALIGERGREVKEFLEKDLQDEGLKKSVLIVATSDQPALIRMKGALLATSIAEYFRDQGKDVLFLMDSLTRFSMALREVGLAVGEPPVTRGYTPSVFAALPKLLERTGNSQDGSITGLYTVLVDGDDLNEPITDTVRGILDGHIVLSRRIANKNHYPAIDVLSSVSRIMPNIIDEEHSQLSNKIKNLLATYKEAEDLINIGAYVKGSNKEIDYAIEKISTINSFLKQSINEKFEYSAVVEQMKKLFF